MRGSPRKTDLSRKVDAPGPGNYPQDDRVIGKGAPSFTFGQKGNREERTLSPGPGAYEPDHNAGKDSIRAYKMGSNTKRGDLFSKEVYQMPGPGNYEVDNKLGKGQSFTMQSRREINRDTLSPGPGAYDERSSAVKDRPISHKISGSKRTDFISKEVKEKPGPGSYKDHYEFGKNMKNMTM